MYWRPSKTGGRRSYALIAARVCLLVVALPVFGQSTDTTSSPEAQAAAKQALRESAQLFPKDSPAFTAALRRSMKRAVETSTLKSKTTSFQLDASTIAPTKLDQDSRYRSALISTFESAAQGESDAAHAIYHGRFDTNNQYPDVVLLLGPQDQICSGVIIASGVVLTALHCVCDGVDVKVGVPNNTGGLDVTPTVSVPARMKVCNKAGPADIGIVFVPPSLRPTAGQPQFATSAQLKAAKAGIIVGFGNTDVDSTGASQGKRGYGGVAIVTSRCSANDIQFGCNQGYEFFAGPTSDASGGLSSDECHGDSGGPMYIETAGGLAIAGIASRTIAQSIGGCGQGGVYERIDGDAGVWIASVIAQSARKNVPG